MSHPIEGGPFLFMPQSAKGRFHNKFRPLRGIRFVGLGSTD